MLGPGTFLAVETLRSVSIKKEEDMRHLRNVLLAIGVLATTAVLVATASAAQSGGTVVKLGASNLGRVLVDAHGKTLYLGAHDKTSKSTCSGDCAEYWPPLITQGKPSALAGVNAKLLGTSRRTDGRQQVTYAGHPLYYFVQDTKPGQTKGEALTGFGGRWDPVSAIGAPVHKGTTYTSAYGYLPLQASVISPEPGDVAGSGGTFSVDL